MREERHDCLKLKKYCRIHKYSPTHRAARAIVFIVDVAISHRISGGQNISNIKIHYRVKDLIGP